MTFLKYKKINAICLIAMVATFMVACKGPEVVKKETTEVITIENENNNIVNNDVIETINAEKILTVKAEKINEETEAYTIEVELPIINGFNDTVFEEEENATMSETIHQYTESIKEMALDIQAEGYLTAPYYVGVNYSVLMNNNFYLSLEVNYNEYTGGAHGNYLSNYIVYDIEASKRVALSDIVQPNVDYMKEINVALFEAIEEARSASDYGDDLHPWYEGVTEESLTFSLQEEGFGVHFNPYEIGPYAEGAPSFIIPYERLSSVLQIK